MRIAGLLSLARKEIRQLAPLVIALLGLELFGLVYWIVNQSPDAITWAQLSFMFDPSDGAGVAICLLYTSPSPRDLSTSRMPSSA